MGRPTKPKGPGKGQFTTTAEDEERLIAFIERESRERRVDLSRAQAIGMLFRYGLDAQNVGVRA